MHWGKHRENGIWHTVLRDRRFMWRNHVIEVLATTTEGGADVYRVWCVDRHNDECAIYIKRPSPRDVKPGDKVWWQGRKAFWTPQDLSETEVPLERVGFSFDPRNHPQERQE